MLAKVAADAKKGNFNAQEITSPADGVIQSLLALPGQMVQAGAPLFVVQILDPVWVRVPVYVGDLAKLASDRDAEVRGLADAPAPPRAAASRSWPPPRATRWRRPSTSTTRSRTRTVCSGPASASE